METALLALIAATSLAATWFCCLRPMRQGRCALGGNPAERDAQLRREITELQEDVRALRAETMPAEDPAGRRSGDG